MPGTNVTGGTIGRNEANTKTGIVAHFGGFNLDREYPELDPMMRVNNVVPKVIKILLVI